MLFRRKKLIDHDPKTLSTELLSELQASLVEKLILVNEELSVRCENVVPEANDLPKSTEDCALLTKGTERLRWFNAVLKVELDHIGRAMGGGQLWSAFLFAEWGIQVI
jgi:hypothetical protein